MLTVEELFDEFLIEEGQYFMGEEYITQTLGLDWKKLHNLFKRTTQVYARRKPVVETKVIHGSGQGKFKMPDNTLAVREVRYDILDEYPRTLYDGFGQINYEYDRHTQILRSFPPMNSLRVSYSREYTFSNSAEYKMSEFMAEYETEFNTKLEAYPRKGSIKIELGGKTMKEVRKERVEVDMGDGTTEVVNVIKLEGDLGEGYYNPENREIELHFGEGHEGDLVISCIPMYEYCVELNMGEYTFVKLYKAHLLESIASARSQITQEDLHNIDFTSDDLYGRARLLKAEVYKNLRETIDFSAMAPI